jgi:hypothetical protein
MVLAVLVSLVDLDRTGADGCFGSLSAGDYGGQAFTQEDPVIAISEFLTKNPDKYDAIMRCMLKG